MANPAGWGPVKAVSVYATRLKWWLPPLLLIATGAYGLVLARDGPASFDVPLLLWFRVSGDAGQLAGPDGMLAVWQALSWLGDTLPRVVVAGLTVIGLLLLRRWQSALFLAGILLSGIALSTALKHWVGRPRPQLVSHLDPVSTLSFPSGHALNSTLFYLAVAFMLAKFLRQRGERWTLYTIATSLSLATGVSRIALGVHFPTDVLAGWIISAAWLWLWIGLAKQWWPKALP